MYYPLVTPRPLEFGSAFHKAMEKFYDPLTWGNDSVKSALAIASFVQECDAQFSRYKKLNLGNLDPSMKQEYDDRKTLGLGMLRYYTKYVSPEYDVNFVPVKVEIEFEVPIKDPDGNYMWCKCDQCWARTKAILKPHWEAGFAQFKKDQLAAGASLPTSESECEKLYRREWKGLPVTYGGRIDMLAKDHLGRYWIFDWKTAARMSGSAGTDDSYMLLDDQITSYCWALWTLGFPVAGFVYAEIKKAVPDEPEANKTQRQGRWYSVNKQMTTTAEIYTRTVKENDPGAYEAGLYDDFITYLKSPAGPKFHQRHQVFRSETELANAGFNIWQEACEMTNPNLRIYPSPGRFSCSFCAYQEPCLSKNKGEDFLYTLNSLFERRTKHYWEDKAPSTDSKGGS